MNKELSTKRIEKDLECLKQFTATPGNGCSRLPFTKETREAAEYLKGAMRHAGLEVHEDSAGNVIGILPGKDRSKPCILTGSHYDSVYNGGDYDGIAGVVAGIEMARILQDAGENLEEDFVVAGFMDEEGCRFGTGYFGSKSILGQMTIEECKQATDKNGISVYEAMKDYGMIPENVLNASWAPERIGKFIELHIEQGPVLDQKKIELGLVDCIVGIQRYMVTVNGRPDHAGTTPMDMRFDAVDMASKVICNIADYARAEETGTVATVGYITSVPGGVNVVAQSASFSIDIRSTKNEIINRIADKIRKDLDEVTQKYGSSYTIDTTLEITPVDMSAEMVDMMEDSCKERGYSYLRMPSGAGHDALAIGQVKDAVMIFVPSKDGRSHCPEEYTPYEDFAKAVEVLVDLLHKLG